MGWKENRRRKRTWYRHYKRLAENVRALLMREGGSEFAAEAIVDLFFQLYESRRMHGKRFIAESAYESMRLACADYRLNELAVQVQPQNYDGRGPNIRGQLRPPPEEEVRAARPEAREMPELPASALAQLGGFEVNFDLNRPVTIAQEQPVQMPSRGRRTNQREQPNVYVSNPRGVVMFDEATAAVSERQRMLMRSRQQQVRRQQNSQSQSRTNRDTSPNQAPPVLFDARGNQIPPLRRVSPDDDVLF